MSYKTVSGRGAVRSPAALSIQISSTRGRWWSNLSCLLTWTSQCSTEQAVLQLERFCFLLQFICNYWVNTVLQNREWFYLIYLINHSVIFCTDLFLPGLYDSNMRPFCSNSQHHSYFSNKVFLQIKSTLADVVTSINKKCNISFTVCEHPK